MGLRLKGVVRDRVTEDLSSLLLFLSYLIHYPDSSVFGELVFLYAVQIDSLENLEESFFIIK